MIACDQCNETASFELFFSFIGMGPDGAVKPILSSLSHAGKLDNSCSKYDMNCIIQSPSNMTNASAIVEQSVLPKVLPGHNLSFQNTPEPYKLPKLFRTRCKDGKCDKSQIFVIDVHNSRYTLTLLYTL